MVVQRLVKQSLISQHTLICTEVQVYLTNILETWPVNYVHVVLTEYTDPIEFNRHCLQTDQTGLLY